MAQQRLGLAECRQGSLLETLQSKDPAGPPILAVDHWVEAAEPDEDLLVTSALILAQMETLVLTRRRPAPCQAGARPPPWQPVKMETWTVPLVSLRAAVVTLLATSLETPHRPAELAPHCLQVALPAQVHRHQRRHRHRHNHYHPLLHLSSVQLLLGGGARRPPLPNRRAPRGCRKCHW